MRLPAFLFLLAGNTLAEAATPAETINYRYDARGRLVGVERSGPFIENAVTSFAYDAADNRTQRVTSVTSWPCPITIPLNGDGSPAIAWARCARP